MNYLLALITVLCWLPTALHAEDKQASTKSSLLQMYLSTPADTIDLEALYQIASLEQQLPTFTYYLNKASELTPPNTHVTDKVDLQTQAALSYLHLHDNEAMLRNLAILEDIKEKTQENLSPTSASSYDNLNLLLEVQYALYYTRTQQPEKAQEHLQRTESHASSSSLLPYRLLQMAAYAEYHQLTKEYDKALQYLDDAIRLIAVLSPDDAITYGSQKANILVEMGRADEALPIYKQISKTKDSLYTVFSTSQMKQIQSMYNMDKLILQKEQRQATFHHICLGTSIIVLMALLLFNVHMYKSRRRLQQDEKEMRRLATIAEEANETKNHFLANMSYNIRIPLNNVVGFSQLLSTDTKLSDQERKEYSGIIQSNSSKLIQLVNDVLDLSRLEANMMKFQLQDCRVQEWCGELTYMVQMRSEGSINLQLHAEVGDATIHTDINRFTQTVLNMLLYPTICTTAREIKMEITRHPDKQEIACRIENSPLADPAFHSQKTSIQQSINQLFFEHFGGTYCLEGEKGEKAVIHFTYPLLTP